MHLFSVVYKTETKEMIVQVLPMFQWEISVTLEHIFARMLFKI